MSEYNEHRRNANSILSRLGKIDGEKHILQILYLARGINSLDVIKYWDKVNAEFKNAINNNPPN